MATAIRQRTAFKFSEDDTQEGPILDEQEQEEVIEDLRKADEKSSAMYYMGLLVVIGLSLLLHVIYLFSSKQTSPFAVVIPEPPTPGTLPGPVPFASLLTLIHIAIQLHLSLYCLPQVRSVKLIPNVMMTPLALLPLPLSHPATILLPSIGPLYAFFIGRSWADVLWWGMPGILTALVALVQKWSLDGQKDLEELEKLRYTARGA